MRAVSLSRLFIVKKKSQPFNGNVHGLGMYIFLLLRIHLTLKKRKNIPNLRPITTFLCDVGCRFSGVDGDGFKVQNGLVKLSAIKIVYGGRGGTRV